MRAIVYIFLGGGLGSVFRFLISNYTQRLWHIHTFPMGTFVVNLTGCLLIGILSAYFLRIDNSLKYLLITGLCGGYTTFSTFSAENYSLWQSAHYGILALYVLLSVVLGLLMVFLGFQMFRT